MKQVYKWCENVFVVEGYLRSCIYDLQRSNYELVPKETNEILKKIQGLEYTEIANCCTEDELYWVDYFIEKEYLQIVPESLFIYFEKVHIDFDSPAHISNAIIEESEKIDVYLDTLNKLGCRHVHLIVQSEESLVHILESYFVQTDFLSVSATIDLFVGNDNVIHQICLNFPILSSLIIKSNLIETGQYYGVNVFQFVEKKPHNPIFVINYDTFFESIHHHIYFNKKMYIDKYGNIRNTQNCSLSSANINDFNSLEELLNLIDDNDFTKNWQISKDRTAVCLDCEFRRMCLDKEKLIELNDGLFLREIECSYNPYISKWNDDLSYKNLKEIGVNVTNKNLIISHKRIREINEFLWER